MAKFEKRGDRERRGSGSAGGDDKGKKGYKAKRSFTRNKAARSGAGKGDDRPARGERSSGDRYRGPRRETDERPERGTRRPFDGDRPKRNSDGRGESKDRYPRKSYSRDEKDERPPRSKREEYDNDRPKKNAGDRRPYNDKYPRKTDGRDSEERNDRDRPKRYSDDNRKPGDKYSRKTYSRDDSEERRAPESGDERDNDRQASRERSPSDDKFERFRRSVRKSHGMEEQHTEKPQRGGDNDDDGRPARERRESDGERKSFRRVRHEEFEEGRAFKKQEPSRKSKGKAPERKQTEEGLVRLNKYLSNAGVASRREADELIKSGAVKVNGVVVDTLGTKIKPTDVVTYGDQAVKGERKVYLLLNKPKDYITTVDDPRERKTVMELVAGACRERIYPVGRLDRNTTGLLLFTNDGELATKLMHPKHGVKKVYHVSLNKGLKPADFTSIVEGIELEDGVIKADDVAFVGEGKKEVGIEIHSGRNRVVRRIFEHLGYDVLKLDRVVFAGLTKKDLPRGKHRFLTPKEVAYLKMIG